MKISINDLKNTMKVANSDNTITDFSAKIVNDHRDISIKVSYNPNYLPKEDIHSLWKIEMKEEEDFKTIYISGENLNEVKDIYNGFISQGIGESYLRNNIIPY